MRAYFPAERSDLERLKAAEPVTLPAFSPESEDELDEFNALADAAEQGAVVIAADIEAVDAPVTLDRVASFHLDADGSGDLAWYAPQEIDQVLELLG